MHEHSKLRKVVEREVETETGKEIHLLHMSRVTKEYTNEGP